MEIILHSRSANIIKDSLVSYKPMDKQEAISEEVNKLIKLLIDLKQIDITRSIFSKVPLVGGYFDKIKKEHIQNKYSDSKNLIDELTEELSKKCAELKQDDIQLEPAINSLKEDIKNNKEEYDKLMEEYKRLTSFYNSNEDVVYSDEETINVNIDNLELETKISVIASGLKKIESLIKNQTVYLTELLSIKRQNLTFVQDITSNIKTTISSIATGLIVASHLSRRNEMLQISNTCSELAADMTLKTANAMKEQTREYEKHLISDPIDSKKLEEAIRIIQETHSNFNNFTKTELPKIMKKLESGSTVINSLVDMVEKIDASNRFAIETNPKLK